MVWAKKIMDCYWICSDMGGCNNNYGVNNICESNNKKGYAYLDKYIKDKTI